jgi:hypothetical protein
MKNGMKVLLVGGTVGDDIGFQSKIVSQMFQVFDSRFERAALHNGGTFRLLETVLDTVDQYDVVVWFPNVQDSVGAKLVRDIKRKAPHVTLVTSKRNDGKYTMPEVIAHGLALRASLMVEFVRIDDMQPRPRYAARLLDPLGNQWAVAESMSLIAQKICDRVEFIRSLHRVRSVGLGGDIRITEVPEDFVGMVRDYGEAFHNLLYPAPSEHIERFLGNTAFRCLSGFPGIRSHDTGMIFVSARNLDKREIGPDGFVPVFPSPDPMAPVVHLGKRKPSVDTPIQRALFWYYGEATYMLHGHVYLRGAPMTDRVLPCGAIEEFAEVVAKFPDPMTPVIKLNLRGHGFIAIVDDLKSLDGLEFEARPVPEDHAVNGG